MTERHGTVVSARSQMCGRGLNVVVARLAIPAVQQDKIRASKDVEEVQLVGVVIVR